MVWGVWRQVRMRMRPSTWTGISVREHRFFRFACEMETTLDVLDMTGS